MLSCVLCLFFFFLMQPPVSSSPRAATRKPRRTPEAQSQGVIEVARHIDMAAVEADTQAALAAIRPGSSFSFKVLTVNIHKGFTFFNRKFILPELREAVRDRKSTRLNSSHIQKSRMPSSA